MEYTLELEVGVPCQYLIELYQDPENLSSWQPEIMGYELISGQQGQVGSKMKLTYNLNQRPTQMVQTITVRDPPNELSSRLELTGMVITVTNRFAEIGPETTFWRVQYKYEFTNFILKVLGYFMPRAFRDQSWKYMNRLKWFAERKYLED